MASSLVPAKGVVATHTPIFKSALRNENEVVITAYLMY